MSTRATVHFCWHDNPAQAEAIVYHHYDGHPSGLGEDLQRFFADAAALEDTRFSDPTYLAARFVAWQGDIYRRKRAERRALGGKPPVESVIDFTGVGVAVADPGDIRYRYRVLCKDDAEQPAVIVEKPRWNEATETSETARVFGTWPLGPEVKVYDA